jgi:hypothetical protein
VSDAQLCPGSCCPTLVYVATTMPPIRVGNAIKVQKTQCQHWLAGQVVPKGSFPALVAGRICSVSVATRGDAAQCWRLEFSTGSHGWI